MNEMVDRVAKAMWAKRNKIAGDSFHDGVTTLLWDSTASQMSDKKLRPPHAPCQC